MFLHLVECITQDREKSLVNNKNTFVWKTQTKTPWVWSVHKPVWELIADMEMSKTNPEKHPWHLVLEKRALQDVNELPCLYNFLKGLKETTLPTLQVVLTPSLESSLPFCLRGYVINQAGAYLLHKAGATHPEYTLKQLEEYLATKALTVVEYTPVDRSCFSTHSKPMFTRASFLGIGEETDTDDDVTSLEIQEMKSVQEEPEVEHIAKVHGVEESFEAREARLPPLSTAEVYRKLRWGFLRRTLFVLATTLVVLGALWLSHRTLEGDDPSPMTLAVSLFLLIWDALVELGNLLWVVMYVCHSKLRPLFSVGVRRILRALLRTIDCSQRLLSQWLTA